MEIRGAGTHLGILFGRYVTGQEIFENVRAKMFKLLQRYNETAGGVGTRVVLLNACVASVASYLQQLPHSRAAVFVICNKLQIHICITVSICECAGVFKVQSEMG